MKIQQCEGCRKQVDNYHTLKDKSTGELHYVCPECGTPKDAVEVAKSVGEPAELVRPALKTRQEIEVWAKDIVAQNQSHFGMDHVATEEELEAVYQAAEVWDREIGNDNFGELPDNEYIDISVALGMIPCQEALLAALRQAVGHKD